MFSVFLFKKSMKYNSTKDKQAVTSNVKMYGKLSVVMGLTWILGFSMEYSVILRFIYLIVNSLQGTCLNLAYATSLISDGILETYI